MKVYTELDTAIQSKLEEIAAFKTVEAFNAQHQNTKEDDAKMHPAAYYELLEPVNWEQAANNWQTATVRARIHIVAFNLKRDKDQLHTLGQDVFEKMNGVTLFDTDEAHLTGSWNRVASSIPKRYRQLKVITIDFAFELYDSSSVPTLGTQTITFNVV